MRKETNKNYKVGKSYKCSEIPENDTEDFTVSEYGVDTIGQNAIHIRYFKKEKDVWFIFDGYSALQGVFKCVYNN